VEKVLKDVEAENRIALVNDSAILFNTLDHIFKWAESKPDFWGLTDSHELNYHMQSYFMVFEQRAVGNLLQFFKNYVIDNDRNRTIANGELGLSRFMMNHGMNLKAFVSMGGGFNPHFHYWRQLIESGVPIIKKKIVSGHRDLPRGVNFNNWHLVVQQHMKWEYNEVF
jgi:lipopolysaccharide biosynthesis protein